MKRAKTSKTPPFIITIKKIAKVALIWNLIREQHELFARRRFDSVSEFWFAFFFFFRRQKM